MKAAVFLSFFNIYLFRVCVRMCQSTHVEVGGQRESVLACHVASGGQTQQHTPFLTGPSQQQSAFLPLRVGPFTAGRKEIRQDRLRRRTDRLPLT